MNTLTIAIPFIIAISVCALNSWINITIKHAPDKASASRETKLIFLRIVEWICNLGVGAFLLREIVSPEPLTRWSVFLMVWYSSALVFAMIAVLMRAMDNRYRDVIGDMLKLGENASREISRIQQATLELISKQNEAIEQATKGLTIRCSEPAPLSRPVLPCPPAEPPPPRTGRASSAGR